MTSSTIEIERLVASLEIDRLVPECYESYRPFVRDAIGFFLNQLPRPRRRKILASLAALPEGLPAEALAVHVLSACPTLHKLGQVLARHEALDPVLRKQLQQLEYFESTSDTHRVARAIRRELGPAFGKYRIRLETDSLLQGSVADVMRCEWQRPGRKRVHRAVLKVLRPGIEGQVRDELAILIDLADYLDSRREAYDLPSFEYRKMLETVRDLLVNETLLHQEQVHLQQADRFYDEDENVRIPKKLPFSTPRVTAMEWIDGVKITEPSRLAENFTPVTATQLAARVLDSLISKVVFSRSDDALFHADPHAGNLFALKDGSLALLDWALVGRLTKRQREDLAAIMWGALRLDVNRVRKAIRSLSTEIQDTKNVSTVIASALRQVRKGRIPGPTWLGELFDALLSNGVQFPADLLLFRKSLFTIKGVIFDIDPNFSIDREFFLSFLRVFAGEFPRRLRTLPFSRDFKSQLSNLDLIRSYLASPLSLARYAGIRTV
ncbi:MAG: AarF/ABC1/UbiB kinase family protein [Candidatus Hydrogenedentes bacterium]|nr:AarF/ABC1/UbiB kinase family protein [Candidatus Hydrogenedentota bacterium]